MPKVIIPENLHHKRDIYAWLVKNQNRIEAQAKSTLKWADACAYNEIRFKRDGEVVKAGQPIDITKVDEINVRAVINTTNYLDSHMDVHLPGLWKKTLQESKQFLMHLQEHRMEFDKIISDGDDLKAYTERMTWKDLGFEYEGETEALIFDSVVRKDRNPFMFQQYAKNRVRSHSVGMAYVKYVMAINDEEFGAEYEAWQKYIGEVANREKAEEKGYFWAHKEAKAFEGSAVPRGSNLATPTLDNNFKFQPEQSTEEEEEPEQSTQEKGIDYDYLVKNFKL